MAGQVKRNRLIKISHGLYRTDNGIVVSFHSWEKRDKWTARWTDWMNSTHEIHGETFSQLNQRLKPYGAELAR